MRVTFSADAPCIYWPAGVKDDRGCLTCPLAACMFESPNPSGGRPPGHGDQALKAKALLLEMTPGEVIRTTHVSRSLVYAMAREPA